MTTKLAFLDTETTGLDPDLHDVWEVGLILRQSDGSEREYLWQLPVDLGNADAMALKIGRWYERRWPWPNYTHIDDQDVYDRQRVDAALEGKGAAENVGRFVVPVEHVTEWVALFAELTDGAHLVGAVISFDEERLRRLLRRLGACPTWHYHLIDVEALAIGYLAGRRAQVEAHEGPRSAWQGEPLTPPWKSDDLTAALGITVPEESKHTALGDARWAQAIYDAVMGAEE